MHLGTFVIDPRIYYIEPCPLSCCLDVCRLPFKLVRSEIVTAQKRLVKNRGGLTLICNEGRFLLARAARLS